MTRAQAHADLRLARALDGRLDGTREALATGALHEDQARVIVSALAELPDEVGDDDRLRAEEHLVGLAQGYDATVLRRFGRRVFEVIAPEEADRREGEALEREEDRARRRTSLRMGDNGDGPGRGRSGSPACTRRCAQGGPAFAAPRRRHLGDGSGRPAAAAVTTTDLLGLGFVELIERSPPTGCPGRAGSTPPSSSR